MLTTPASRSGERVEHVVELLLQQREVHRVRRYDGLGVLDQVAELGVAVLTQRGVEGDRLATVLLDLDDLLRGHVELLGELLRRRLPTEVLQHLALDAASLLMTSTMWTGMRIVRAWSAMARVMACLIHHVAYVENL